jgi:hypothetical protein
LAGANWRPVSNDEFVRRGVMASGDGTERVPAEPAGGFVGVSRRLEGPLDGFEGRSGGFIAFGASFVFWCLDGSAWQKRGFGDFWA